MTKQATYLDYEGRHELRHGLDEIHAEVVRQVQKWGIQNHNPIEWIAILMEEVGEAASDAQESHFAGTYYDVDKGEKLKNYRVELIQVAAVALSALQSLDRQTMIQAAINNAQKEMK